jgi:16S rRNA (cytosine967-C5)-methyltransferase
VTSAVPRSHPPSSARVVAARVLQRVSEGDAFADLALEAETARAGLDSRDAALATELVFGTLRWQRYLDWILAPHSRRPLDRLDPTLRAVLRLTAYQLTFLERIPPFAAVSDAVSLVGGAGRGSVAEGGGRGGTGRNALPRETTGRDTAGRAARGRRATGRQDAGIRSEGRRGVADYANAVLRSFTGRHPREREPAAPTDPVEAAAIRCSFPTWLAARWIERLGVDDATRLMLAMNERPPLTIRANTLRVTRDSLADRLRTADELVVSPTRYAPEGLVVERGGTPGAWSGFEDGTFVVQDEGAMLIAHLLDPRPGETVADVCAAPGVKTTHLATLMGDRGRVLALDPHPRRLARVVEAARRLRLSIIEAHEGPVEIRAPELQERCEAVLVDAPCSNLGVLRRNPEAKWRRAPGDLAPAAARQRQILGAAVGMVAPGGRLVYATCSLEPEENEAVIRALMAEHPELSLDPPASFPIPLDPDGVLRCRPDHHGTDGFTAVRLRRTS